jgi:hypothetical protein
MDTIILIAIEITCVIFEILLIIGIFKNIIRIFKHTGRATGVVINYTTSNEIEHKNNDMNYYCRILQFIANDRANIITRSTAYTATAPKTGVVAKIAYNKDNPYEAETTKELYSGLLVLIIGTIVLGITCCILPYIIITGG